MITVERLNELMKECKPFITYDKNLAEEFLKTHPFLQNNNVPESTIVDYFTDHLLSQCLEDEIEL